MKDQQRYEIERRFLPKKEDWQKHITDCEKLFIIQGYPETMQSEGKFVRIRETTGANKDKVYEFCVKGKSEGTKVTEDECEVNSMAADHLFSLCADRIIRKWRWIVNLPNNPTIYIDQFTHIRNDRSELVIIEIEFLTEEEALEFVPPKWAGKEITGMHQYSNFSLSKLGEPL